MPTGFIFSSALFVYGFVYPELPQPPSLFEFGLKSPLRTFLSILFFFSFLASGRVNKGLKNCRENFHISALMCRGRAKCESTRESGEEMQRRRGGGGREPEEMYNREDVKGTNW